MNREPLFGCDGECECGHREEDLRVFEGDVLCDYCWEERVWPEAPNFEQAFSDLPPFKSPHLVKNHPDGQWDPIETAPMDGTPILAYSLRNNALAPIVVTWRTYHPNAAGEPTWRDHQKHKVCGLTHWMPLPKPPKKGSEE